MVRNVNLNVNVDSCFTISCELVGRLPNLKRWKLSTMHMPGVEGVVGEVKSVSWGGAQTKAEVHKGKLTNKMFLHSDFDITEFFPDTTILRLENSHCELMR